MNQESMDKIRQYIVQSKAEGKLNLDLIMRIIEKVDQKAREDFHGQVMGLLEEIKNG